VRILVHEFFSGGGLAGRDVPASLGREGSAMLTALVADLAALDGHHIVTTMDPRFPLALIFWMRCSARLTRPGWSRPRRIVASSALPRGRNEQGSRSLVPDRPRSAAPPTKRLFRDFSHGTACRIRKRA
jgi:hypothetical protein